MAKVKSYTDLEQSKKLAKILPIESADMKYKEYTSALDYSSKHLDIPSVGHPFSKDIPCWSLAALLDILPDCIVMNKDFQNDKYHFCSIFAETFVTADNPIDACYEFIMKYMN